MTRYAPESGTGIISRPSHRQERVSMERMAGIIIMLRARRRDGDGGQNCMEGLRSRGARR